MSLIDKTGYSYSGVCDVVRNSDDNAAAAKALLIEINTEYKALQNQEERLVEKLRMIRANASNMVSLFLHVHEAMGLKEDLTFQHRGDIITVSKIGDNLIDYSSIPLTDFSTLNDK